MNDQHKPIKQPHKHNISQEQIRQAQKAGTPDTVSDHHHHHHYCATEHKEMLPKMWERARRASYPALRYHGRLVPPEMADIEARTMNPSLGVWNGWHRREEAAISTGKLRGAREPQGNHEIRTAACRTSTHAVCSCKSRFTGPPRPMDHQLTPHNISPMTLLFLHHAIMDSTEVSSSPSKGSARVSLSVP